VAYTKSIVKVGIQALLAACILVAPGSAVLAEDFDLDDTQFYSFDGLDGRGGFCSDYGSTGESSGEVGFSTYISVDSKNDAGGSIQASFDDGRPGAAGAECERKQQVYTIVDRGFQIPGMSGTMMALKLNGNPCPHEQCLFSTMFAGPNVALTDDLEGYTEEMKFSVGPRFPDKISDGENIIAHLSTTPEKSRYTIPVNPNGSPAEIDLISINQTVFQPEGKPYFDVTWSFSSNRNTYENVKFWYYIDTYTSGNDFGYGYICDTTSIAGGSGGSAFFQGTLAMHPSAKQVEGWWAKNIQDIRHDDLPLYTSNPLSDESNAPLTALDDNSVVHEWDDLTISPEGSYITMRWTFDDPIRKSTYGTTRSLFTISSDDESYKDSSGVYQDTDPMVFDVRHNPQSWRGNIATMRNPKACSPGDDSKCESKHPGEKCLPIKGCSGTSCQHFCALSTCSDSHSCGSGRYCIFDYCLADRKWATEDNPLLAAGGAGSRNIFTIKKSTGNKVEFSTLSSDSDFKTQLGVTETEEAQNIIDWVYGTLNNESEKSLPEDDEDRKVITDNKSHDFDLHSTSLLRARYEGELSSPDEWLLHDIAHAEPVYLGAAAINSWSDDHHAGASYGSYINDKEYQERRPVLLVSANDGMLHCFDANTGDEIWAFVPWDIIPKLKELASPVYDQLRTPTVDLKPTVFDVCNSPCDDVGDWTTRLVLGSREGGDTYWAFDIKPPSKHLDPEFKWYFTDDDLGLTYSVPVVGRFKSSSASPPDSKWLVFFGSGYAKHSAEQMTKKGYFYALNMFCDPSGNNKLNNCGLDGGAWSADNQKILISNTKVAGVATDFDNNVLSDPIVVDRLDSDGNPATDGFEDTVYIGDMIGHLMRFTDSPATSGLSITGAVLFNTYKSTESSGILDTYKYFVENPRLGSYASDTQKYYFYKMPRPITTRPQVWREPGQNYVMVFFGSGKYDSFYDSFDDFTRQLEGGGTVKETQSAFGIVDEGQYVSWDQILHHTVESAGPGGKLRTLAEDSSVASPKGWRIEFNGTDYDRGERIITDMQVLQQEDRINNRKDWIVFFTTFTPNMQATCDLRDITGAGAGYLMTVKAKNGKNPDFAIQDIDGDSMLNSDTFSLSGETRGYAGQKFSGTILSRVVVDSASKAAYVKAGPDSPVIRIQIMGQPTFGGQNTLFYRIK